jgi:hypothetical protein
MAQVIARLNKRTGELELEVNGVKGEGCLDITRFVHDNMDVVREEQTAEMWDTADLPDYVENM